MFKLISFASSSEVTLTGREVECQLNSKAQDWIGGHMLDKSTITTEIG